MTTGRGNVVAGATPRAGVVVTLTVEGNGPLRSPGDTAPDLLSRYQDYVERKVATARATREIYEGLLARVASGELDPRALDRGLNHFSQVHGPDYASGIAELSMRFLAGVVQAGSRYSYELVDEMAPGAVEPPTTEPPGFDPADWADSFQQLIAYAQEERAAHARALRVVMDRVARGELDPETVERVAAERSRKQVPESVTRLADLSFEMLTGLEEANTEFGMGYLRSVVHGSRRKDSIERSGAPGEPVEVRLVVSNDASVDTTMHCVLTDVRREDGIGPAFDPEATITPDTFDLAPDAEAQVTCSVLLTDAFASGATYVGELRVLDGTVTVLEIPVRLRVGEPTLRS